MMNGELILDWLNEHGVVIAAIILVSILAYWLLGVLTRGLSRRIQEIDDVDGSELDKRTITIFRVVRSTGMVIIIGTALLMILTELGVPITPVLASVGFVGLAFGLGAQTLVKDIINGLFILVENQYTVGDKVEIAGIAGDVEVMTLRATIIRDLAGTLHTIPNGDIRIVANRSRDWSRAIVDVGITYDDDVAVALETLAEIGNQLAQNLEMEPLLLETAEVTGIEGLDDWAVRLRIMVKTEPDAHWRVQRHLRHQIQSVFAEKGIELAFPRQDILLLQPDTTKEKNAP